MSIAPMTISSDRQTVLDFTQPYMTFGLAFMMRVQEVKVNYFRFLLPFSQSMWIAICVLVMVMGFLVWICSLFSPWGYYGRCLQVKPSKQVNDVHFVSDFLSLHGKGDYFCASSRRRILTVSVKADSKIPQIPHLCLNITENGNCLTN